MLTGVPLLVALIAQVLMWLIPGCNPNPYALGICSVGPYNIAAALVLLGVGGAYLAMLSVPISAPLLLVAWWLSHRARRAAAALGA